MQQRTVVFRGTFKFGAPCSAVSTEMQVQVMGTALHAIRRGRGVLGPTGRKMWEKGGK